MAVYAFEGKEPRVAEDAFVAPNASVIGEVVLEAGSSVWFGAVLRGDFGRIVVGEGSCIQDNTVVHAAADAPTIVGANVTIGHAATLEGCVIEDGALIASGAIVLTGARVGAGALVAAGSVVREGQAIPPGVLAAGVPAVVKTEIAGSSRRWIDTAAAEYRELRRRYLDGLTVREETRW